MKRLIILLFLFPKVLFSQEEFSFELYFEDALGNKDTVTIGYDTNATSGINAAFGEIDILGTPWNSDFEVRISNFLGWSTLSPIDYYTKKKIVSPTCELTYDITLNVKCTNYPILITWDTIIFDNDSTVMGSFLSSHFDSQPCSDVIPYFFTPLTTNFWTISTPIEVTETGWTSMTISHNDNSNLIKVLNFGFGDMDCICWKDVGLQENLSSLFSLYPNPTQNEFFISLENSNEPNLPFKIIDISGKVVLQNIANMNTAIDISNLPNGYYIVQVNVGEQFVSKPLIVNR